MRTTCGNDFHFGDINHEAVEAFLTHCKEKQSDKIILQELLDAHRLSSFNKVPGFGDTFEEEIAYARQFLKKLREVCPKSVIVYIESNHEIRFKQLIWNNVQEMSGLSGFSIPELLHLDELNIQWVPIQDGAAKFVDNFVEDQGFLIGHFNAVRKGSGNTVRGLLDKYGRNIIQGHVHRLAQIYKTVYDKTLVGVESGCLCSLKPSWMRYPDWQNGFVDIVDGKIELHQL